MNDSSTYRGATCIVTAILGVNALLFFIIAYGNLFSLGDVTMPEGAVVYAVKRLLSEHTLYHDYHTPPFAITPYTPLFYLISAFIGWIGGQSISAIYVGCRLLSFACTLGAAYFVCRIAEAVYAGEPPVKRIAFLLPFTILTLIGWGYAARPDMMAVMLSLAGIYVFLRDKEKLACAAVILALAWWCKQSFIAAPAAVFLTLISSRQWRGACRFAAIYVITAGILIGVCGWWSHGWFFDNIFTANVTTLRPEQIYWLVVFGYFHLATFVSIAALLTCYMYFRSVITEPSLRCVVFYLLASVALSMAACMKEGAYFNYMLEPLFVASILAAVMLQKSLNNRYAARAKPALLLASLVFSYTSCWNYEGPIRMESEERNGQIQAVLDKINHLPGDVLTSESNLAVRADKPVLATDLFNVRYLEEKGKLDTHALADRIRNHELSAIIAPEECQPSQAKCDHWPEKVRSAILEQYAPGETLYHHVFWYPKSQ